MNKIKSHLIYYFLLIDIVIIDLILIRHVNPNRELQLGLVTLGAIFYAVLGLAHHLLNHDLVLKIVVEYILIAALGITAAFFIFRGGFGF